MSQQDFFAQSLNLTQPIPPESGALAGNPRSGCRAPQLMEIGLWPFNLLPCAKPPQLHPDLVCESEWGIHPSLGGSWAAASCCKRCLPQLQQRKRLPQHSRPRFRSLSRIGRLQRNCPQDSQQHGFPHNRSCRAHKRLNALESKYFQVDQRAERLCNARRSRPGFSGCFALEIERMKMQRRQFGLPNNKFARGPKWTIRDVKFSFLSRLP